MKLAPPRTPRPVLLIVLVLLLGVPAQGQRPAAGGGAPLLIDFTAVTADGKPVTDLTPADIAIRIGGKVRTVSALDLKKMEPAAPAAAAPAAPSAAAAPAAGPISPPFFTNDPAAVAAPPAGAATGRSYLIIVDTESLVPAAESGFKAAIEGLLKGLTSADKVALSTAPRDTAQVGFGTSLDAVRQAVAALKGQRPATVSSGDALCRTSLTLALIHSLIQPLALRPTPTSVILIAAGLSTVGSGTGSMGSCEVIQPQYQAIADSSAEARANIFVVQGDPGTMGRDNGLEQLAGVTGAGAVMRVSGDGFAPRVLAESSTYWVATIAPDPADRPGLAQRLEVRTTREGVTVHTRALAAVSRAAAPAAAAAKPGTASPKEMIASTAAYTDLRLNAATIVQRGQGDKMNVFVFAQPVDPTVKLTAVRVGYFDTNNKGGSIDAPQILTYPITTILPLSAGQFRIRVAATDASGKSGAVDVKMDSNLVSAGPFRLSGLLTGAPNEKGNMTPRLVYGSEEKVQVMFELYGVITAEMKMRVGFEIAESDSGPATATFQPIGVNGTNEPDKFQVFGEIPIADLKPGDYVIRAVVQLEGQPEGKALRTIRKIAK